MNLQLTYLSTSVLHNYKDSQPRVIRPKNYTEFFDEFEVVTKRLFHISRQWRYPAGDNDELSGSDLLK